MRLKRIVGVWGAVLMGATAAYAQAAPLLFPVTIQQAIQYAVDNYPAIQASAARTQAQEAGVDLARTAYLPRVDTTFQVNRATRNNVTGLLLPGTSIPSISGPVSDVTSLSGIWGGAGALVMTLWFTVSDQAQARRLRAIIGLAIAAIEVELLRRSLFVARRPRRR